MPRSLCYSQGKQRMKRCRLKATLLPRLLQAAALLQQLFGIQFVYLVNEKAQGYGAANTRGIDAASGEFIVLINNDM
jgi:hypothetical protein